MANEFDEVPLRSFSPEEIKEINEREAQRAVAVPAVEKIVADRNAKWAALRKKYPLPEGAAVHTVENMGLIAYAELALNAYGFDPIAYPDYRPDLAPLPTEPQRAEVLGLHANTLSKKDSL